MLIASLLLEVLVALYLSAEWLVRGGASFAVRPGVTLTDTPILIGFSVLLLALYGGYLWHLWPTT